MIRYALLARGRDPVLWDFGSAVRHHQLYSKWVPEENYRAGFLGFRGAVAPSVGLMRDAVAEIKSLLVEAGVADMPVGVDIVEPPFLFEMQRQGLRVVDAQQIMLDARVIKSPDEIMLLTQAVAMVDGVYQDIVEHLKPGVRENEIVALANKRLYEMGSDQVEAINAISGERCNPHPHNFTDRLIRPGDQAFFDIIHSFNGYRTCYYRTFSVGSATPAQRDAYQQAREWMDRGIDGIRAGVGSDQIASLLPAAEEFGFGSEMAAFGLQFAHGLGLGLHERPIISRLNSFTEPVELQAGMVFALETYCPATDGFSAARIEEEIVITETGPEGAHPVPGPGPVRRQPVLSALSGGQDERLPVPSAPPRTAPDRTGPAESTRPSAPPSEREMETMTAYLAASSGAHGLVPVAVVVALITAGATLIIGWLNLSGQKETFKWQRDHATKQIDLMQSGQITDRFMRAIEQLGSSSAQVRIGAIFALERIGRESPADRPHIVSTLAALVRERAARLGGGGARRLCAGTHAAGARRAGRDDRTVPSAAVRGPPRLRGDRRSQPVPH